MFYSLLSAAVHPPVHISVAENCSSNSVLKQALDCLLAKRRKSKYLDNNTAWFSPTSTRLCVSTMDRDNRQHLPPKPFHLPPNPALFPSSHPPPHSRNRETFPPWNMLDKSLPASHLQKSLHSVNITELPILLEIKSILEWQSREAAGLVGCWSTAGMNYYGSCKASKAVGLYASWDLPPKGQFCCPKPQSRPGMKPNSLISQSLHSLLDRALLSATTQQEQLVITGEPMDWFPIQVNRNLAF